MDGPSLAAILEEFRDLGWDLKKKFWTQNESRTGMSNDLLQYRRIVEDFATTSLAAIPNVFGRLVYVSSLRDLSTGKYEHAGLSALYPENAVQQALALCHEELFLRILETPLALQESDLRDCLQEMSEGLDSSLLHWQRMEAYRVLIPEQIPGYLKELFCSNLRVLLEILSSERSTAHSSA